MNKHPEYIMASYVTYKELYKCDKYKKGYMENVMDLQKSPFDKPIPFVKMFDAKNRTSLMETIKRILDNAVNVIA